MPIDVSELPIRGAWLVESKVFPDDRGSFQEWFRPDQLAASTGYQFVTRQANESRSRRGVVRGIHFADVPPGQAKWVRCTAGSVTDFIVDLRVGSPTFGATHGVALDGDVPRSVVLSEGLGHAFVVTSESATVGYLVSTVYDPDIERVVHPLDPDLAIPWPLPEEELLLSPKDAAAPSLVELQDGGLLPGWRDSELLLSGDVSRMST